MKSTNIKQHGFTKNDSVCLKGIAIILLMCIHSFGNTARFKGYEFDFGFLGQDLYVDLAYYCKISVSIFAFISGYGLYLSLKNQKNGLRDTNKWVGLRLIKTMNGFWLWYVISFVIMQVGYNLPAEKYFGKGLIRGSVYMLLDFLGLAGLFGTPTLNAAWWYMSAAIAFIALMPALVRITQKTENNAGGGWLTLFATVIILPRLLFNSEFFGAMNPFSFILPVCFGALFAEFDLFTKINNFRIAKNKIINELTLLIIGTVIIIASILVWIRVPMSRLWEYHFGVAPVLLIIFCNRFILGGTDFLRKGINKVLFVLGKYSMSMYIFHSFIRTYILKDFLYSMKYPILTIVSLLLISLAIAVVFSYFQKLICYNKLTAFIEKKFLSLFDCKSALSSNNSESA